MRKTIVDVAADAGVSIKTVSRVVNGEPGVRPEMRARVEAAVARLNFRPSLAARAMAGGRSFQIALIYDNPSPYYVHQTQEGARARCEADGMRLIVQPCRTDAPDLLAGIEALVNETRIDGVILSPPVSEEMAVVELMERRGIAVARVSPGLEPERTPSAFIDDEAAAQAMTAHLAALGHRRIGFVAGPGHHVASAQRHAGHRRALAAAGLPDDPSLAVPGRFSFESGRDAAGALLGLREPPTAIFASNDDMAAGVIAAAHARGIAVPGTLSVAGFDDTDLATMVWPPLTTIRQPIRALFHAAADLLIDRGGSRHRRLPFTLVERGSAGRPAA